MTENDLFFRGFMSRTIQSVEGWGNNEKNSAFQSLLVFNFKKKSLLVSWKETSTVLVEVDQNASGNSICHFELSNWGRNQRTGLVEMKKIK